MSKLLPLSAVALTLVGTASTAMAATQIGEYFTVSGFGTLGAVQTNSNEGQFSRDRQGTGATKSASFSVDSNLGVQLTGQATPWLSGTVQVLAAMRGDEKNYVSPAVEWAYLTIKPVDGLTVRAGRMATPVFATSDSRNIGYANTWVRAPNEVYALNVFTNMDGLNASYRRTFGQVSITAMGYGGKSEFLGVSGSRNNVEGMQGLAVQLEWDWLSVRLNQTKAKVRAVSAAPTTADPYKFSSINVTVDRDELIAQAEYVTRRSQNLAARINSDAWFVMGGYRFGSVTPYAIISRTSPKTLTTSNYTGVQKTTAIGVRWDAFSAASVKMQLDRINTAGTKGASFVTPTIPATTPGGRATIGTVNKPVTAVSIAVDFTF